MKLSPHFSDKELWCQCCHTCHITDELLELAEAVRRVLGGIPMYVNQHDHSAYRCPKHNREVGGVEDSPHIDGKAMDFDCGDKLAPSEVHSRIMKAYSAGELPLLGGIGKYKTFIHVDTKKKENGKLRKWSK